jgi:Zn-dependent peptidase ImmA (M78 family)
MIHEQRHRIAHDVVEAFRSKVQRTHADLYTYPLTLDALTVMISETYPIAVHQIADLDIHKVSHAIRSLGGELTTSTLDNYMALAGFLYAHRGGGAIFIERGDSHERRKFSLAHELGHFINDYYHPIYLKYESSNTIPLFQEEQTVQVRQVVSARCTKGDIFGGGEPETVEVRSPDTRLLLDELQREQKEKFKEIKANFFAAELLMPIEECRRLEFENHGLTQQELTLTLMKRFGVSRAAAAIRVEELQLGVVEEGLW